MEEAFDDEKVFQEYLNNLLQNPPQPVHFRYTVNDIAQAVANFKPKNYDQPINIIEDYQDEYYKNAGDLFTVTSAVYRFYSIPYKNSIEQVNKIVEEINNGLGPGLEMPHELSEAVQDIKNHKKYLDDMQIIKEYNNRQAVKKQQEQVFQRELESQKKAQQIQEARYNEIQSKLPVINEKLNHIRKIAENTNLFEARREELLRERLYFYHQKNNITQEAMDRLDNYLAKLNSIEQEIVNAIQQIKQEEQVAIQEQQQIEQLKEQIQQYDNQITILMANIQPYMQIPKVNQEISKVRAKNDEINSKIIDNLQDYKSVVEVKQTIVAYLEQANKFIMDNVNKKQKPLVEQPIVQSKPDTQSLSNEFWDEFDKPNVSVRPERKFNDDGTYTMEYIAYLANTPYFEFNKSIYNQLLQYNESIRARKNNFDPHSKPADTMIQEMINGIPLEEQNTGGRRM